MKLTQPIETLELYRLSIRNELRKLTPPITTTERYKALKQQEIKYNKAIQILNIMEL